MRGVPGEELGFPVTTSRRSPSSGIDKRANSAQGGVADASSLSAVPDAGHSRGLNSHSCVETILFERVEPARFLAEGLDTLVENLGGACASAS